MSGLVLDTHAFLWLLEGDPKLPVPLRSILGDAASDLYLPALVVAELVDLIGKGRSRLDLGDLHAAIQSDSRLQVVPMDVDIALSAARFTTLTDIHDRCIVATTANLIGSGTGARLVPRDALIRDSGFAPTMWD